MTRLKKEERKNYNSYKPSRDAPAMQTCKLNHLHIALRNEDTKSGETLRHQIAKALGAIMVRNFGDIKFSENMLKFIRLIEFEMQNANMPFNPANFISEAVPNKEKDRRVDLVNLTTGDRIEFETNHKIRKENAITIYI